MSNNLVGIFAEEVSTMKASSFIAPLAGITVVALVAAPFLRDSAADAKPSPPKAAKAGPIHTLSPSCQILANRSFVGDTTIGAGCGPLLIGDGVVITVDAAARVDIGATSIQVQGGGTATIQVTGVRGAPGSAGANGSSFPFWTSGGGGPDPEVEYNNAKKDAQNSPANTCHGHAGETGKRGGSAEVFLPAGFTVDGTLVVRAIGGPGGDGGAGGRGTTLRNGRNFYCDGCQFACSTGATGGTGPEGAAGSIFVGTTKRATGTLTLTN